MNELSAPVFAILTGLIEDQAGLHFGPQDRELFADKIAVRVTDAGFDSALDYYYFLRYDPAGPAALAALVDSLTVNETYFFRELEALRMLVSHVIAPAVARGETPRIWSAACASGEEPLTLAMLLADRGLLEKVELVGTDLSERVLGQARSGRFGQRSLRALPEEMRARYFELDQNPGSHLHARVSPHLVSSVQWRTLNLMHANEIARMGTFDAILCRNVLIYFSDDSTRSVVSNLARQLRPGGMLLVGTSESLLRFGTELACEERAGVFYYTRSPR